MWANTLAKENTLLSSVCHLFSKKWNSPLHTMLVLTGDALLRFRGTPLNWASFSSVVWRGNLLCRDSQLSSPVYFINADTTFFFCLMFSAACRISFSESCRCTTFLNKSSFVSLSSPCSGIPTLKQIVKANSTASETMKGKTSKTKDNYDIEKFFCILILDSRGQLALLSMAKMLFFF